MAQPDPDLQTRLIHADEGLDDTTAASPPIYQTSTYRLPTPEQGAELAAATAPARFYTRYGSPNAKQVERLVAETEGGEAALALGSGMAAISTALLSNLRAGDHIVAQRTHYTGCLSLLADTLPRYGIEVTQVDQRDAGAFERALRPNTRIVYTESPTNPTLELTDLAACAALAHRAGALAITDNTFASGYNQRPLALGCDLVVHSATKYLNGHADVTAGVIVGGRAPIARAWEYARTHGPVLHPFEAWLLRRGLQTYCLRMAVHNANATEVARFLESHPQVSRVHYPGLESHPQHALAQRQMRGGYGGMLSFELKGGFDAAYRAIARTRIAKLAVSLGGVETLIIHPASMINAHQSDEDIARAGVAPSLIRLSVGIEAAADIIADLDQALRD
ncbi:MAG TPA: aminotransferase class I/II-fold pyridoxal phosphate-dependent enzyme [Burkholderiales bacterium]|nr:aminotransferase class I/II-fold pyridoxal phosphate-dependent enzyme [Burkholderiales bacterium]